jgi:hypothetical protein
MEYWPASVQPEAVATLYDGNLHILFMYFAILAANYMGIQMDSFHELVAFLWYHKQDLPTFILLLLLLAVYVYLNVKEHEMKMAELQHKHIERLAEINMRQ